jgi:hypothetical protein
MSHQVTKFCHTSHTACAASQVNDACRDALVINSDAAVKAAAALLPSSWQLLMVMMGHWFTALAEVAVLIRQTTQSAIQDAEWR